MFKNVFGDSTKSKILAVLSQHPSLNAKNIYVILSKHQSISYQAIHKILVQLEKEKVLIKNKGRYEISLGWVMELKNVSLELENVCNKAVKSYIIDPNFKKPIYLRFDDLGALSVFCANLTIQKKIVGKGNPMIVTWLRHLFMPFNLNFNDYTLLRKMVESNGTVLIMSPGKSPLDLWVRAQYLKSGFEQVKTGMAKGFFDEGFFVHGDGIVEITSSKKTKEIMDKVYNRNHNLGDLFKEVFFRKDAKQKLEFNVKISKNPKIAEMLRTQMLSYFK